VTSGLTDAISAAILSIKGRLGSPIGWVVLIAELRQSEDDDCGDQAIVAKEFPTSLFEPAREQPESAEPRKKASAVSF
jgi:hypothetical protein